MSTVSGYSQQFGREFNWYGGSAADFRRMLDALPMGADVRLYADADLGEWGGYRLNKPISIRGIGAIRPTVRGTGDMLTLGAHLDVENVAFDGFGEEPPSQTRAISRSEAGDRPPGGGRLPAVLTIENHTDINLRVHQCEASGIDGFLQGKTGTGNLSLDMRDVRLANLSGRGINIESPIVRATIESLDIGGCFGAGVRLGKNIRSVAERIRNVHISKSRIVNVTGEGDTHAIIAYGRNINIDSSYFENVHNLSVGESGKRDEDAEAVYLKVDGGSITNSEFVNACGTNSEGSIAIKGRGESDTEHPVGRNVYCGGNRIKQIGSLPVKGIQISASFVIAENNKLIDLTGTGIATHTGNISQVAIRGNLFGGCSGKGIYAAFDGNGLGIFGNQFYLRSGLQSQAAAIRLQGRDGANTIITSNMIDMIDSAGAGGGESAGIVVKDCIGRGLVVEGNSVGFLNGTIDTGVLFIRSKGAWVRNNLIASENPIRCIDMDAEIQESENQPY